MLVHSRILDAARQAIGLHREGSIMQGMTPPASEDIPPRPTANAIAYYRTNALQYPSSLLTSAMDSSMMPMALRATSLGITMGGLMRRMWPAGIQARPLAKAFW